MKRRLKDETRIERHNDFLEALSNEGYTYVSGEYETATSKYVVICPNNHEWKNACWKTFKKGTRCKSCGRKKTKEALTLPKEEIIHRYESRGYNLVGEYVHSGQKTIAICPNGHEWDHYPNSFFSGKKCLDCENYNRRGKNGSNWNGGLTPIRKIIRERIYKDWTKPSLELFNYRCAITGQKSSELVVHHLYKSFQQILDEAIVNVGIDIDIKRDSLSHLLDTDLFNALADECIKLHINYGYGVPLLKEVHKKFHDIYGYHNTTLKDFEEFELRCKNGEFQTLFQL